MQWGHLLRRSVAFFLAVVTLWVLTLTADMGAAAERLSQLGESATFVEAALTAELGAAEPLEGPLEGVTLWDRVLLGQSVRLANGERAVADFWEKERQGGGDVQPTPAPTPTLEPVPTPTPPQSVLTGTGAGPQILIVHTHSTEAYSPTGDAPYTESDSYRTTDPRYSVIAVGDALAEEYGKAGFTVLHDRSLYDYPKYSGAYTRSSAAVSAYLAEYPSISVVFDVHRDAIYEKDGSVAATATYGPTGSAQVLLVVGGNQNGLHPGYAQNLAFAEALRDGLERDVPKLCRGAELRASHYYQQLSPGSLLLEMGSHGDTLEQAVAAVRLFGVSSAEVIRKQLEGAKPPTPSPDGRPLPTGGG